MFRFPRLLSYPWLLAVAALAGCSLFSDGPPREKHATQSGFTVRVDGPGLPGAASVVTDIGAFAQRNGFVRQSATPELNRYVRENLVLEVSRQPADHRVTAHVYRAGPARDNQFIERFYRDFDHEYAGRYGGADRISETAYAEEGSGRPALGTLEPGGTTDSSSPLQSGVPPVSGNPSAAGDPAGR